MAAKIRGLFGSQKAVLELDDKIEITLLKEMKLYEVSYNGAKGDNGNLVPFRYSIYGGKH